jgi:DNA-binding response OmpR family regulator
MAVALGPDATAKLNFEGVSVLILEQSQHSLEIALQMFYGFGARNCHKSTAIEEAMAIVDRRTLDLVVVDPNLKEGDGLDFVRRLRTSDDPANRTAAVFVTSANGTLAAVHAARDAGTSFFLVKPVTPAVLMDRILRVTRDKRAFIVCDSYAGPDRRFKMEGPPPGCAPRRSTDIITRLGDATQPNLSQDELDSMFKPQKVNL